MRVGERLKGLVNVLNCSVKSRMRFVVSPESGGGWRRGVGDEDAGTDS